MDDQHLLERRSTLLAAKMKGRIDGLASTLRPRGARPVFTEQVDRRTALDWWKKHKNDEYGQKALRQMDPIAVMDLERELAADDAESTYFNEGGGYGVG